MQHLTMPKSRRATYGYRRFIKKKKIVYTKPATPQTIYNCVRGTPQYTFKTKTPTTLTNTTP